MKKTLLVISLAVAVSASLFAQDLPRLAVVEFSTNVSNERVRADAVTVRNLVESQMVGTRRYQIITRNEIDQLMANQRIQVSEISSTENIARLQLQNISYIVTGSVDAMGDDYAVTVRVLDVSTGQFSHSDSDFMGSGGRELFNGIGSLMTRFISGMATEGGRVTQATSRTYAVGDFGPAGGIVFYDKGVFSNGWRYLEAAPAETEFRAQWGAYERDVAGTQFQVGFGRRNTELIVERLRQLGETGRAAQLCAALNFDGFNDWFLPSREELNLMYTNLRQKGLGGFDTTRWYWSSSQNNSNDAWNQSFGDGRQGTYAKYDTRSVRPVRAF